MRAICACEGRRRFLPAAPLSLVLAQILCWAAAAPDPAAGAEWFRGNTHAHTVLCGHADSTPEQVARWYLDRGYHFLILSEHNRFIDPATVELPADRREDFILVPGQEVTGNKVIHTTAMNTRALVPWDFDHIDKSAIIQNHVDETRAAGGRTIVNHPNFHFALAARHLRPVRGLCLFELYNGHPMVHNEGDADNASTERMWDELLTDGMEIYGVSSDDAHEFQRLARNLSNPGRGWVMVRADRLDPDLLTEAMARGDFYASSGVFLAACERGPDAYRIEVDAERTLQELEVPDLRGRAVEGQEEGWRIAFIGPEGTVLREVAGPAAEWPIDRADGPAYVRVKVTYTRRHPVHGTESYFAWGQPVFADGRGKPEAAEQTEKETASGPVRRRPIGAALGGLLRARETR